MGWICVGCRLHRALSIYRREPRNRAGTCRAAHPVVLSRLDLTLPCTREAEFACLIRPFWARDLGLMLIIRDHPAAKKAARCTGYCFGDAGAGVLLGAGGRAGCLAAADGAVAPPGTQLIDPIEFGPYCMNPDWLGMIGAEIGKYT
jgi:hypothetical protein